MIYFIIDILIHNILHLNINTFLYKIHNISLNELLLVLILNIFLNNNYELILLIILIYILNKIIYTYVNYQLLSLIITYSIYYIIVMPINITYIINIILVIILYKLKYNDKGERYGIKKISRKFI